MSGLSTAEILAHRQSSDLDMMITGGYPQLWAEPQLDREFWYAGYLATYLERDIRNILNVGHLFHRI